MKRIANFRDAVTANVQVAALPWREGDAVEIMLISSRETRRWVTPKGWPMNGKTDAESAAREALEEAGIVGEIEADPIGAFHYIKRRKNGSSTTLRVDVFPMHVERQRKNWPEKHERTTKWVSVAEAAESVDEPELRELILAFGAAQQKRKAAAR